MNLNTIEVADALTYLQGLPDESVNCVVTSPPYFGLRDYGTATWRGGDPNCDHVANPKATKTFGNPEFNAGRPSREATKTADYYYADQCGKCGAGRVDMQIGHESSPQEYVAAMVCIFREVKRVLRKDGTVWVNIGDSYANDAKWGGSTGGKHAGGLHGQTGVGRAKKRTGTPPKSLMLIPQRLAIALQDEGWIIRNEIVWHKRNPMPSSAEDRFTTAHEVVWFMTKSPRYWSDMFAVREPVAKASEQRIKQSNFSNQTGGDKDYGKTGVNTSRSARKSLENFAKNFDGFRNARDVWSIASEPFPGAHFAVMPSKLVEKCIHAGCPELVCVECGAPHVRSVDKVFIPQPDVSEERVAHRAKVYGEKSADKPRGTNRIEMRGWEPTCTCNASTRPGVVLDMFMGTGTVARNAAKLRRQYIGCDLNPEYVAMAMTSLAAGVQVVLL